jgi:N-acyl-phosphatidylethanolamine-hydrolysing phospholipase D
MARHAMIGATPQPLARPAHHDPAGGFRNPWPAAYSREPGGVLRWRRERRTMVLPPNPPRGALPLARPHLAGPGPGAGEIRITWVGHSTFLIQLRGLNILTDPQWSRRASPVQFAGPSRLAPPGLPWDDLPGIDAVLLSHDHYDHLDSPTVRRLHRRFGERIRWFTPLGYRPWLGRRGIKDPLELDWWEVATLETAEGFIRVVALPCQHWTRRTPWDGHRRLWASWAVIPDAGPSVYFCGDSGYFPGFPEIHQRMGEFDALLLPIGAYEPRWFMRPVHMNPEEAVQAYLELGGTGTMVGMHWGTFRLTDEDPLEPPVRTRAAWAAAGLSPQWLWIPQHGETRVIHR